MARCGCSNSQTCPCLVTAGDNIEVTGTGQADNPFVISAAAQDPLTFSDTATVDLIRTGNDVVANVKIDPTPGNLLEPTAQGLRVSCDDISSCVALTVADTPSLDLTLAGTGTAADPWILSGVAAGAAGGLLTVQDTPTVDLTLTGTGAPGDPYVLSATSAAAAAVVTGCGLTGTGVVGNGLRVNVTPTPWTYPCTPEVGGGLTYCDANGRLRTEPEHHQLFRILTNTVTNSGAPINSLSAPDGIQRPVGINASTSITNPSACRPMLIHVKSGIRHALVTQPPGSGNGRFEVQLDSVHAFTGAGVTILSPIQQGHQHWGHAGTAGNERAVFDTSGAYVDTFYQLAPGATGTLTLQARFTNLIGTSNAEISQWDNMAIVTGSTLQF